jgi:hypothetical protein
LNQKTSKSPINIIRRVESRQVWSLVGVLLGRFFAAVPLYGPQTCGPCI